MRSGRNGFTLVEVLVVISILGVLAAVAIPQYLGYIKTSKMSAAHTNFSTAVRQVMYERAKRSASPGAVSKDIIAELNYGDATNPYHNKSPAFMEGAIPSQPGQVSVSVADLSSVARGDSVHVEVVWIDPDGGAVLSKGKDILFD